jgi:caffeoyl-CoA O-methyltransferase
MSTTTIGLPESVHAYLIANTLRDHPALAALREETARMPEARMQISPEQGQFMQLVVELMGAKRIVEVGTFTGYSATAMALALPADGTIVCCDVSERFTAIARRAWKAAGVEAKVDLRIAPAIETLDALIASGASFDLAFIDADKHNYDAYYERCLALLRPGGVVMIDNVLWSGRVADPSVNDADTTALRALNGKIRADPRVSQAMLPISDGLTLARKRA